VHTDFSTRADLISAETRILGSFSLNGAFVAVKTVPIIQIYE
jgi:hypothetical protein